MDNRVKFEVPVFAAGQYSQYGYSDYTDEDISTIANRTNSYGVMPLSFVSDIYNEEDEGVPITIEHADTVGIIDAGFADRFYADGPTLRANLNLPEGVYSNLSKGTRGLSIEIDPSTKVINRITLTSHPLVKSAVFSEGAVNGQAIKEGVECYSTVMAQESTMAEAQNEETQEEVEVTEEVIETPTEETPEETPVAETEEQPQLPGTEEFSETEARIQELEERNLQLEKRNALLEDEKIKAEVDSFSVAMVGKGVPPAIVNLLAPTIVKGKSEKYSSTHSEFGIIAGKVMEFFSSDEAFKALIVTSPTEDYILETNEEKYSVDAIKARAKKYCEDNGHEVGGKEYIRFIATEAVKSAE